MLRYDRVSSELIIYRLHDRETARDEDAAAQQLVYPNAEDSKRERSESAYPRALHIILVQRFSMLDRVRVS
jgi:hypothetical protein